MRILLFIVGLIFISLQTKALTPDIIKDGDVKGIYATLSDFRHNTPYLIDGKHSGDKVKLNQFFFSSTINCMEDGQSKLFYKDSIFAITLKDGRNFRFINREPYLIADTSCLYIYSRRTIVSERKQEGPHTRTINKVVTGYFFSTGNHSSVIPLSIINLRTHLNISKTAFDRLDKEFITDEALTKTNKQTGRFRINELLLTGKK
ncbi:hypothetical protein [Paludibacter sp.]|uniref:hypothetical protein n=1 Tax=Paludibacter sp. TaxID=1898105 RepID=UPI0013528313|nr:hypothetical protein [Paludibacter sp.]MTK53251.1 hypothetical protein [Paludibacter sp.]